MLRKGKGRTKKSWISKKRNCSFCQEKRLPDFKNPEELRRFLSERGRIISADETGICTKHQRKLSYAVKRARYLGLLPFVVGIK